MEVRSLLIRYLIFIKRFYENSLVNTLNSVKVVGIIEK